MVFASETGSSELSSAARAAGLSTTAMEPGTDFTGQATTRLLLSLESDPSKTHLLELSSGFPAHEPRFSADLQRYFSELAQRLRNPRPDVHLTMLGLPLSFRKFAWPFHGSTSGADTFIVHGEVGLETGGESVLSAKISASLTRTFAEVVPALEQPFAEGFIFNAVRKTLDQGQLELVKSGNRQPVPVTTRYYSAKQQRFVFNDTNEVQRREFLLSKVFWLSHMLGANMPVWVADPRDAQYLDSTAAELEVAAASLAQEGWVTLAEDGAGGNTWAAATDKLAAETSRYEALVNDALQFIKPTFNESMRSGQTNM